MIVLVPTICLLISLSSPGVEASPGGMMGYGGVLAMKRSDHDSDYAFDFSHSQGEQLDIADYTLYESGDEHFRHREDHRGSVSHDYVETIPHNVEYDYLEREADLSHYDEEEFHDYGFHGFDYSVGDYF